jgi:2-polyprenyl-6-methoxyphenol hydroxylase-like FAD-dependent oxidoreductase
MHGIYLKRNGVDVVVLEQEAKNIRSGHNAGIGFGRQLTEFLQTYDRTMIQNCTAAATTRIAYRKRQDFYRLKVERHASSWGLVYRILRANFDGLSSEPIPNPPPALEDDGRVEYRAGKKVTKLSYQDGLVTVGYVGIDGTEESVTTDLVIGADGLHSTVRSLARRRRSRSILAMFPGEVSYPKPMSQKRQSSTSRT